MEMNSNSLHNALDYKFKNQPVCYNQRDLILYALGIGVSDLRFIHENDSDFQAFPLYPVVLPFKGMFQDVVPFPPPSAIEMPEGLPEIDPSMILHAEQYIEMYRPLTVDGDCKLNCGKKLVSFCDKGKGALMETETMIWNEQGEKMARLVTGMYVRGLTGFESVGRKPMKVLKLPKRFPDAIDEYKTASNLSQIYRLSGDYNGLHVDPSMANMVGFQQPILHGLCTMGIATNSVYKLYCKDDPGMIKSVRVRFSKVCYPGETLVTSMWRIDNDTIVFSTQAKERKVTVLTGGEIKLKQAFSKL